MEPELVGYFPGLTPQPPAWFRVPGVVEICSANRARIQLPKNWYHQQRHNALLHFDSQECAWTVLQDDILIKLERDASLDPPWRVEFSRLPCQKFDLYAYKVFPVRFVEGQQCPWELAIPQAVAVPSDYQRLGYDVVSWSGKSYFGCCPLFCHDAAANQEVNRYCLLEEVEAAFELAASCSAGDWKPGHYCCPKEPGPYCVVEVWRKAKPFQAPERSGEVFEWPGDLLHRLLEHEIGHGEIFR